LRNSFVNLGYYLVLTSGIQIFPKLQIACVTSENSFGIVPGTGGRSNVWAGTPNSLKIISKPAGVSVISLCRIGHQVKTMRIIFGNTINSPAPAVNFLSPT
jgi:hypothetical protein